VSSFKLPVRSVPRWVIFFIDLGISLFSLALAYLVRFEFLRIPDEEIDILFVVLPTYIAVRALMFLLFRTHRGIVRYTGARDVRRIFLAVASGTMLFFILSPIRQQLYDGFFFLPFSILIIEFMNTLFLMVAMRMAVKVFYLEGKKKNIPQKSVVIFGAGESGIITKRTLDRETMTAYKVIAFVDDDPSKSGMSVEGTSIFSVDKLPSLLQSKEVDQLIISIMNPDPAQRRRVIDMALAAGVDVLSVPPVSNWIGGQLSSGQIRKVKIEDLLGRAQIELDDTTIAQTVNKKVVLVTGAAGSIGSGLVRALLQFNPQLIVLLDQAESPLYELENEIRRMDLGIPIECVMGDVTNQVRMERLFDALRPMVVFHAAAYKHVPMMELNPTEAVRTNVLGTRILVDLSRKYTVQKFVMVSTDKAVNPTSVMGASKRIAEMYAQSANVLGPTTFVTTRFGNVLGSNGSVIPLFRKQIEQGGPITVTHPEVTRYFMTIPEACNLVLEAGAMGQGGEIFIFDMGESVLIKDLAEKMIRLSGLTPGVDIEIKYTGLRPGEKLYEELLNQSETTLATHHPKILKAKVAEMEFEILLPAIDALVDACMRQDNTMLVKSMKALVPEFISNNSEYTLLDKRNHNHESTAD